MELDECDWLLYAFDGDSRQKVPTLSKGISYFFTVAAVGALGTVTVTAAAVSSAFTAGVILSAFFTNCATCQICVSVKASLKPGIPVMRIPPSTFQ